MLLNIGNFSDAALFFDFDGTLVDLASTPDAVEVSNLTRDLLVLLHERTHGALAIITGRNIASLDSLLKLQQLPASGSHGAEWRFTANELQTVPTEFQLPDAVIADCLTFASRNRLIVENKTYSLAIHFRQQPEKETHLNAFLEEILRENQQLAIQAGKFVKELKIKNIDKGVAVARFMDSQPFTSRQPWYFGDDLTDEKAFSWVNTHGGVSVKIGKGETVARNRLGSPDELISFLTNPLTEKSRSKTNL